jgi:hypothetical protein
MNNHYTYTAPAANPKDFIDPLPDVTTWTIPGHATKSSDVKMLAYF